MNMPDYDEVNAVLQSAGAHTEAAEVHGLLCGLLCAHAGDSEDRWLREVLGGEHSGDLLAGGVAAQLHTLYVATLQQLSGESFTMDPFLPSDTAPLPVRAASVGAWCSGLLLGLSVGGVDKRTEMSEQGREILHDLRQISAAEAYEVSESEEDEKALFELVEYLRVGASLLREELRPNVPRGNRGPAQ